MACRMLPFGHEDSVNDPASPGWSDLFSPVAAESVLSPTSGDKQFHSGEPSPWQSTPSPGTPSGTKPDRLRRGEDALVEQGPLTPDVVIEDASGAISGSAAFTPCEKRMWSLEDFELAGGLGSGTYGYVQLARERDSKAVVALKVMKKRRVQRFRAQRHVAREIEIQRHLRHASILQLFGFFWDATYIYTILEHAPGGDLAQRMKAQTSGRFEDASAADLARQIAGALAYLHQLHVIHRDVKPQNILFSRRHRPKLADFGWAVHTLPDEQRWTLCGTLDYLSPEMVRNTCGHSFGVDVWGLGAITYEMLLGQPPFSAASHEETYRLILAAAPEYPDCLSEHARHFLAQLLQRTPTDRMRLESVPAHQWTKAQEAQDLGKSREAANAGA